MPPIAPNSPNRGLLGALRGRNMNGRPRVPEPATADFFGEAQAMQVNHCRMPACENFGLPAKHEPQKPGRRRTRGHAVQVHSTNKGQSASIKCKSCGENPPLKSNAAIVQEMGRLIESDGLLTLEESAFCPHEGCANHGLAGAGHRRSHYSREGIAPQRARGAVAAAGMRAALHRVRSGAPGRPQQAAGGGLFSRIANKSPLRGAARGQALRLPSTSTRSCASSTGAAAPTPAPWTGRSSTGGSGSPPT